MAEGEGQEVYIKEAGPNGLKRYEKAVSALNTLQHIKEESPLRSLALGAFQDLYAGFGNDPDDYLVTKAITESRERGDGNFSNDALIATRQYVQKHGLVTLNTTIGQYINHVGVKLPREVSDVIKPYASMKIGDIEKIEDEEERKKVETIVGQIKTDYETGRLFGGFIQDKLRQSTQSGLERLAQEEKKAKEEAKVKPSKSDKGRKGSK